MIGQSDPSEWIETLRIVMAAFERTICTGAKVVLIVALPAGISETVADLKPEEGEKDH